MQIQSIIVAFVLITVSRLSESRALIELHFDNELVDEIHDYNDKAELIKDDNDDYIDEEEEEEIEREIKEEIEKDIEKYENGDRSFLRESTVIYWSDDNSDDDIMTELDNGDIIDDDYDTSGGAGSHGDSSRGGDSSHGNAYDGLQLLSSTPLRLRLDPELEFGDNW